MPLCLLVQEGEILPFIAWLGTREGPKSHPPLCKERPLELLLTTLVLLKSGFRCFSALILDAGMSEKKLHAFFVFNHFLHVVAFTYHGNFCTRADCVLGKTPYFTPFVSRFSCRRWRAKGAALISYFKRQWSQIKRRLRTQRRWMPTGPGMK